MTRALLTVLCFLSFSVLAHQAEASGKPRIVALVIGNNAYQGGVLPPLNKAVADGKVVASKLKELGADVRYVPDANSKAMTEALIEWGTRIQQGDIAFFYFSGHGFSAYESIITAVDASKPDDSIQDGGMVGMSTVVAYAEKTMGASTQGLPRAVVVVLDACRSPGDSSAHSDMKGDRGIKAWAQKQEQTRSAPVDVERGFRGGNITSHKTPFFVFYSTAARQVASERSPGPNSLFTESLVKHLGSPGVSLTQLAASIAKDVGSKTKDSQQPWGEGSPKLYNLQLIPPLASAAPPSPEKAGVPAPAVQAPAPVRQEPVRAAPRLPPGEGSFGVN